MKKIIYSKVPGGQIHVVIPVDKATLERSQGAMTDQEYEDFVRRKSIPEDAINVRDIDEVDLPADREFRNAWRDVTEESRVDICCTTAKEIKLAEVRARRNVKFKELDQEFMLALEKGEDLTDIKARKQALRDITNPLKNIDTVDKFNDEDILEELRLQSQVLEDVEL